MVFKSCVPFTDCISEINNNAKGIDAVMLMYNLIEHSDNYSTTSGNLWQFYRHEPFVNNHGVILDVPVDSDNASFSYEQKMIGQTGNYGTKVVQIMVLLKYLSNFWRTFEMPLITCKIIFLVCSEESIIATGTGDNQEPKLAITDTKLFVPVVALSAQDNEKLFQQFKTGFKGTVMWNKY